MNRKQLTVIWVALAIVSVMAIFPPWLGTVDMDESHEVYMGYHFVVPYILPAYGIPEHKLTRIYISKLAIQVMFVAVIAGSLVLLLKDKSVTNE